MVKAAVSSASAVYSPLWYGCHSILSSNADISRGRGFADAATGAAAGSGPSQGSGSQGLGSSPTRGVRDRQVIYYVLLSLAALLPGLAGWFYGIVGEGTVVGTWHGWLLNELQDIKFGSGFRFWLGVTGASMMGVMLLYPLRKLLVQRSAPAASAAGSISTSSSDCSARC